MSAAAPALGGQARRKNVLLIVIDQLRADVLDGALAGFAPTPRLDAFAKDALAFRRHHTVTMPCGPARASLLTGQYAQNHRAVRNGAPLAWETPNLARALRAVGYEPLLFGYTDQQPDPSRLAPADPARLNYTHVMPGFTEVLEMRDEAWRWLAHLRARGYDVPDASLANPEALARPEDGRLGGPAMYRAEDSDTAFLTDETLKALDVRKATSWFALVTFIRPHPPFVAPAPYHAMIDPAALPAPHPRGGAHPFAEAYFSEPWLSEMFWGFDGDQAGLSAEATAIVRATYLGLVAEVDHHFGRILDWLEASGQRDDTLVIVTADHGEMLGDQGMWGKLTPFTPSHHTPLLIRDPELGRVGVVEDLTESIDLAPTILDWVGAPAAPSMDGVSLTPFFADRAKGLAARPRDAAFISFELGDPTAPTRFERAWGRPAHQCRVAVAVERDWTFAHFGGGAPAMLFHTAEDPACAENLAARPEHAETVARMRARLLDHRLEAAATGDRLQ